MNKKGMDAVMPFQITKTGGISFQFTKGSTRSHNHVKRMKSSQWVLSKE